MRFEIYVKESETDVINMLSRKGRSQYVVDLVKKDLKGGTITKDDVIKLIMQYGCSNKTKDDVTGIEDSISSVLGML